MKRAMKKRAKILFAAGVVCVLFLLASIGYAVTYNESRLVVPMDLSAYEFTIKDLPMIVSVTLVTVYVCAVVVVISVTDRKKLVTRRVDPRLGFLGILGFLGLQGFQTGPDAFVRVAFLGFFWF